VLDGLQRREETIRLGYLAEEVDSWYGYALLLENDDEAAPQRLRRAVTSMRRSDRMLELPTAAVYLAEAEWRAGDEDAARRAADVALEAARRQGSNYMLLQALANFPAVATRRLDAAELLVEFGRCALVVDGESCGRGARSPTSCSRIWRPDARHGKPSATSCSTRCSRAAPTIRRARTCARRCGGCGTCWARTP